MPQPFTLSSYLWLESPPPLPPILAMTLSVRALSPDGFLMGLTELPLPISPDHLPLWKTVSSRSLEMEEEEGRRKVKGRGWAVYQHLRVRGKLSNATNPISHSLPQISPALKTGLSTNKKLAEVETGSKPAACVLCSALGVPGAVPGLLASPGQPVLTWGQQVKAWFHMYRS